MLSMIIASQTYENAWFTSKQRTLVTSVLQVILASLFLGLCAQVSIPLSPVPLTGQTFGVMLIGAVLGSRKGALSVLLYLLEGCVGMPVFACPPFSVMKLLGPTGGYLLAMVLQAYLIGWFVERQTKFNSFKTMTAMLVDSTLQMGLGVLWLGFFIGYSNVLMLGFYPFILGEVLKSFAVLSYLKARVS